MSRLSLLLFAVFMTVRIAGTDRVAGWISALSGDEPTQTTASWSGPLAASAEGTRPVTVGVALPNGTTTPVRLGSATGVPARVTCDERGQCRVVVASPKP